MKVSLILFHFIFVSSNGDSDSTTHFITYKKENIITVEPK